MNAPGTGESAVIVLLPAPHQMLPFGPLWAFLDDNTDGLAVVGQPDQRRVLLAIRSLAAGGVQHELPFAPATVRAVAAALLAAADHAERQEARP
jgi:hypothetical protein